MSLLLKNILYYIKGNKSSLWGILGLFVVYGLLKSVVYFAPLLLNNILDDVVLFGQFEYALNIGQTCASFLALGLPSAYAFYVFKNKEIHLKPLFHNIFVALSLLLILIAFIPGVIDSIYFNSLVIGIVLANQLFITTFYKLLGQNIRSVVIDCGIYILLLVLTFLLYFHIIPFSFRYWNFLLLLYAVFLNLKYHLHGLGVSKMRSISSKDWKKVISYGALIVVTLFLTSLLNTSTRIYIEHFNGFLDVGMYSFYIRVASAIIIFHRVIVILLFRRIYTDAHTRLDRYFAAILITALCACFLMFWLVPRLLSGISFFDGSYANHRGLFLFSLFQAVSWATVALLELIIYRENLLKRYAFALGGCLLAMFTCLLLCAHFFQLTVELLLWINVLFILMIAFCQLFLLKNARYRYCNTFIVQLIIFAAFIISGVLIYIAR